MGGIDLTEAERLVLTVTRSARQWIGLLWPACLVGYVVVAIRRSRAGSTACLPDLQGGRASRPLWALAVISVAIWAFILPTTQSEAWRQLNAKELTQSEDRSR
jgi:hypothetical protein